MVLAMGASGGEGEEPFMAEEFELKAGDEEGEVGKCGDLLEEGAEEKIERRGGFAGHLGAEDGLGQTAGGLEIGILLSEAHVFLENGSVDKAEEVRFAF